MMEFQHLLKFPIPKITFFTKGFYLNYFATLQHIVSYLGENLKDFFPICSHQFVEAKLYIFQRKRILYK